MKKPVIELKKVYHSKQLSEETPAYRSDLWVDGKKWGYVQNDGHGGPDLVTALSGGWDAVAELDKRVKETFDRFEPCDLFPEGLERDLEIVCHELLTDQGIRKEWTRRLKKQVCAIKPGTTELYTWPQKYGTSQKFLAAVKSKGYRTLNDLPLDEALTVIKQCD